MSVEEILVPLSRVTPEVFLKLVVEPALFVQVPFAGPLKVIKVPDALAVIPPAPAVALKFNVPLFVRLPSIFNR